MGAFWNFSKSNAIVVRTFTKARLQILLLRFSGIWNTLGYSEVEHGKGTSQEGGI